MAVRRIFKKTNMEVTYGIINIALVDNKPCVLSLRSLIDHYISHRKEVVVRRTRYDLGQAERRFHILEGLMKAINMLDQTIALIRASTSAEEANEGLQQLLGIDEDQAKAILDMRLQKLTGLELNSIRDEYNALIITMNDLKDILANDIKQEEIFNEQSD